jgi:hypothetical protein
MNTTAALPADTLAGIEARLEQADDGVGHVRPWLRTMLTHSGCPGASGTVCGKRTRRFDTLCQPCFDQTDDGG